VGKAACERLASIQYSVGWRGTSAAVYNEMNVSHDLGLETGCLKACHPKRSLRSFINFEHEKANIDFVLLYFFSDNISE